MKNEGVNFGYFSTHNILNLPIGNKGSNGHFKKIFI